MPESFSTSCGLSDRSNATWMIWLAIELWPHPLQRVLGLPP
jgi:hypothetical protein